MPIWYQVPFYLSVSLSLDIDECKAGRNTCANDTVCFNLDGGYDCRCPHGHNCTGDCIYDSKVKHNGQIWVLENDRCSVCSCQVSKKLWLGQTYLNKTEQTFICTCNVLEHLWNKLVPVITYQSLPHQNVFFCLLSLLWQKCSFFPEF